MNNIIKKHEVVHWFGVMNFEGVSSLGVVTMSDFLPVRGMLGLLS